MIIITGGAGFIGSNIIWALNNKGYENILVVDNLSNTEKWQNLANLRYLKYMHRDAFLESVMRDGLPDNTSHVIHMGACSSTTERNADFLMANNCDYSIALCQASLNAGARFIYASSAATYGDGSHGFSDSFKNLPKLLPLNMYGYSKQLFDLWCWRNNLLDQVVGLKFFNVYGPDEYHKGSMMSMMCRAVSQMKKDAKIRLFKSASPKYQDGEFFRDFVYSKDCADLILWLMDKPHINGLLNVGTGEARSWNDVARSVLAALDIKTEDFARHIEYVDMPESIRAKYQYHTQADMEWVKKANYPGQFQSIESGVNDYIRNHLLKENPYLHTLP